MLLIRTNMRPTSYEAYRVKFTDLKYLARPKLRHCYLLSLVDYKLKTRGIHQQQDSRHDTKNWRSIKIHKGIDDPKPTKATREASTLQVLDCELRTFWLSHDLFGHTRMLDPTNLKGVSMRFQQDTCGNLNSPSINFSKWRRSTHSAKASLLHNSKYHRQVGKATVES
jgi:hypothetical protein